MSPSDLIEKARELHATGTAYALITVVRAIAPTSAYVGAQAIVRADGSLNGWIGGGCAKGVVIGAALAAIASGKPRLVRISNDALLPEEDVEQYTMACASNGTIELFIQPHGARGELCVLGDTPAADEARFLAQRLQIGLADAPGDASVVLVATQGQGDEAALEAALCSSARQVLLIASRRKADKLRDAMRTRGVGEEQIAKLQAPAGPDAGAKTPAEIALLAIAGVLACLRGRGAATSLVGSNGTTPSSSAKPPHAAPGVAPATQTQRPTQAVAALAPAPAKPGEFINPVCGMAVNIAGAVHVEHHAGQAFYFCCDGCWVAFRQDPGRYAALHPAA